MEKVNIGGKVVNLKKGRFGYRVVHPIKDENGKIIPINFLVGGWANFFKIIFIIIILLLFFYGVKQMMISCNNMAAHPEQYFKGCYNASERDVDYFKVCEINEEAT